MAAKGTDFIIRPPRLPQEEGTLISFIHGLQVFENAIEPNRRVDATVGEEYFRVLMKRAADNEGRVFVAEAEGEIIGWIVSFVQQGEVYVVEAERRAGYIAELFVAERARGAGAGRVLLAAAEADFRARGLKVSTIGVVAGNDRAHAIYERAGFRPYATILRKKL